MVRKIDVYYNQPDIEELHSYVIKNLHAVECRYVAYKTGLSYGAVYNIKTGKTKAPRYRTLLKIYAAIQQSYHELRQEYEAL